MKVEKFENHFKFLKILKKCYSENSFKIKMDFGKKFKILFQMFWLYFSLTVVCKQTSNIEI